MERNLAADEAKSVTVKLRRKLWRRVRAKALAEGRPVQELVAEALEGHLRRPRLEAEASR